jgi:thiamine-phosphate pyrophosphorylase
VELTDRRRGDALPQLVVFTDRRQAGRLGLVATVAASVAGGARAVVFREKDLGRGERVELGCALVDVLAPVNATLLVAGADVALAAAIGARGLHLAAADPFPENRAGFLIGRSCHDLDELQAAAAEGADYATVSPIFASLSKPGYGPVLGPAGLAEAARASAVPVVALGGITPANARRCLAAGAAGVGVMGTIMRADDPTAATAALFGSFAGSCVTGSTSRRLVDPSSREGPR